MSALTSAARWRSDTRGTVAVIFGISVPVLFFCAGMAVDVARLYGARRTTVAAVDAAVLAGGRALQLNPDDCANAIAMAEKVYLTNTTNRTPVLSDTISFSVTDDNNSVVAHGAASLKTTILGAVGIHDMSIVDTAASEFAKATRATGGGGGSNVEISLMLDVTGSMCDDRNGPCTSGVKLSGLKTAAKDLIDIVVSRTQAPYTSRVALVPFSTRVRVGPDGGGALMMKALTDLDDTWRGWMQYCTAGSGGSSSSETNGTWVCTATETRYVTLKVMPCVTDRFFDTGGFDASDRRPLSNDWLNAHDGSRVPKSNDSASNAPSNGRGGSASDPSNQWNFNDSGTCGDIANANEVMPLTSDKDVLKQRIDGLEGFGSTAGALGTAWAWYTLSPEFNTVFPSASAARSYADVRTIQANGAPVVRKVAVLLTDGVYNTFRGWKEQNQQEVSNYAKQLCTNMKDQGIEVYTIGLALDTLSSAERAIAEETLKDCGTDARHFYDTLTVPQMQAAFRDIALQLTTVYLSK